MKSYTFRKGSSQNKIVGSVEAGLEDDFHVGGWENTDGDRKELLIE